MTRTFTQQMSVVSANSLGLSEESFILDAHEMTKSLLICVCGCSVKRGRSTGHWEDLFVCLLSAPIRRKLHYCLDIHIFRYAHKKLIQERLLTSFRSEVNQFVGPISCYRTRSRSRMISNDWNNSFREYPSYHWVAVLLREILSLLTASFSRKNSDSIRSRRIACGE